MSVLVVGLARSGRAAAELLARHGHRVIAVDSAAVECPELAAAGVEVRAPFTGPVVDVDEVVKSPGVPGDAPPVAAARARGIPVISEIELAHRHLPNPIVGVTGTNGKTTTTELAAHLLRTAGIPALACGNQGTPLSGLVDRVPPDRWLIVECSSFQLEDIERFHPRAAAVINVTPDHLDRHGDMDSYLAAKLRIFANQDPGELAIVPRGIDPGGRVRPSHVDEGPPGPDAAAWSQGGLHLRDGGRIAGWDDVALRGRHNRQNAMVAAALARASGADPERLAEGLATFPGVPHRLEVVARLGGVLYVNDSKATNPDAALAAMDAYPANVLLIAGGRSKGTPFAGLAAAARGAVRVAYLVGEAAAELERELTRAGVPSRRAGTIPAAVAAAARDARPGDVVLLAPACTSFDQYTSFEERGDDFRAAVRRLTPAS